MLDRPTDRSDVERRIQEVLHSTFGIALDCAVPTARLREDLALDSIDLFDLVSVLERDYGAHIDVAHFRGVETIEALTTKLWELLRQCT